ncbi:MAG: DNA-processing protein DprA [Campylobacterota bacterium]|nr:DNA-processing protein DprA [Campylobacterota bacterium]
MNKITSNIPELENMKKYPSELFYEGDLKLLQRKKISIIGTRKPSKYSRAMIQNIASALSNAGICIVSGGAMGIDAIAHNGAGSLNTISVLPCGIDIKYPAVNKNLLTNIGANGLLISQFQYGALARPYSFVVRNEVVVALGDVLIVGEAELNSGSMRSIEFALEMGKKIYVLPHRIGESSATNKLLEDKKAEAIYDIDKFISQFSNIVSKNSDDFLEYCKHNPTYEEVLKKFPDRVFEAELSGEIEIKNAIVFLT